MDTIAYPSFTSWSASDLELTVILSTIGNLPSVIGRVFAAPAVPILQEEYLIVNTWLMGFMYFRGLPSF